MAYSRIANASVLGSLAKDISLPEDAQDTISSVSWSPVADHLAAASWDGKVRIYDVNAGSGAARGAALLAADGPLLDCDWAEDGTLVVAGGADAKAHILHVATSQTATLGPHAKPVRCVRFVKVPGSGGAPIVATGSWDRTVKYWDLRQRDAVATVTCCERVYAMDAAATLLVVGTAAQHLHLIDLRNPSVFLRSADTPFKSQTRAVAAFPDGAGWGIASIEGRCGINVLDEATASDNNFTFRCHRTPPPDSSSSSSTTTIKKQPKTTQIWAVNVIQFHPARPTVFMTAGSDGTYHFWDRIAHSRLKSYPAVGAPITAAAFSRDGAWLAYASGYDWHAGAAANTPSTRTKLALHPVTVEESTPKKG